MKPGLYAGLSFEKYRAIDAINKSGLDWFRYSPAHYFSNCRAPDRPGDSPSPAQRLGTAIHMAVLEPQLFFTHYKKAPVCDRRTKEGKATWEAFSSELNGREALSPDDWAVVSSIQDSILKNDAATTLLENGQAEVTMVWEDPVEGVLCKGRVDWIGSVLLDLKSCADASRSMFAKQVANLGWHVQDAWYSDGYRKITGCDIPFVFGALEKVTPFASAFYTLDDESREAGRAIYRARLAEYARCVGRNYWPAYQTELTSLRLPAWALKGDLSEPVTEF